MMSSVSSADATRRASGFASPVDGASGRLITNTDGMFGVQPLIMRIQMAMPFHIIVNTNVSSR